MKFTTASNVRLKADLGNLAGYTGNIPLAGGLGGRYYGNFGYMTWYQNKTFRRVRLGNSYADLDPMTEFPYVRIGTPYVENGTTANGDSFYTKTISHNDYTIKISWLTTYVAGETWLFYGWYENMNGQGVLLSDVATYTIPSTVDDYEFWAYAVGSNSNIVCPVEGTLITMADGTTMPIEQLQVGDMVQSANIYGMPDSTSLVNLTDLYMWNTPNLQLTNTVAEVTEIEPATATKIISINNGQLSTTITHTHIVKKEILGGTTEWTCRAAFNLAPGDILLAADGSEIEITNIETQTGEFNVYTLNVEGDDTYIANGIITHNVK